MISSSEIAELAAAISAAQGELENAAKSSTNPAFRSKYADITACLDVVRPTLSKHGLAIVQGVEGGPDLATVLVTTRLLHKSGQWIESTVTVPLGKRDAQGVGSAGTYGRRYGLAAMVGLGQEDDDGNTAVGTVKKTAPPSIDKLRKQFETASTKTDIDALAKLFVELSPEQQKELMPLAQAARTRCGL